MQGIIHRYLITTIVGTLCVGLLLANFVRAEKQEDKKPAAEAKSPLEKKEVSEGKEPERKTERRKSAAPDRPQEDPAQRPPKVSPHHANTEPTTFLGVAATEVPAAVRAHLDLPRGVGISVAEVMPESPAAETGLKAHDVLTRLDDQILVTPEQFQILVRMKEPGDKVKLTYLSAGKERTADITLASRRFPLAENHPFPQRDFRFNPNDPRERADGGGTEQWRTLQREWSEKMRDWWEKNGDEISEQFRKAMDEAFEDGEDLAPRFKDWLHDTHRRDQSGRFDPHRDRPDREQGDRPESGEEDKDPI